MSDDERCPKCRKDIWNCDHTVIVFEQDQIGWFNPASKRFCYTDEKSHWPDKYNGYTVPVYIQALVGSPAKPLRNDGE